MEEPVCVLVDLAKEKTWFTILFYVTTHLLEVSLQLDKMHLKCFLFPFSPYMRQDLGHVFREYFHSLPHFFHIP